MVRAAAVTEGAALHFTKEAVVGRDLGCRGLPEHVLQATEDEHGTAVLLRKLLFTNHQFLWHKARSLNLSDIFGHTLIEAVEFETNDWGLNGVFDRLLT